MKKILFFAVLMLLTSCEGLPPDDGNTRSQPPTDPAERAIWDIAYDGEYKFPDGFYTEPVAMGTSIGYLGDNLPGVHFYKLRHTDSRQQAREWWHSMMEGNPDEPTLLGENETDKHFEFVSVTKYGYIARSRFHKSSYFIAAGNVFFHAIRPDWHKPYTMGIYGGELKAAAVRELVELLWFFEPDGEILSTEFNETADSFTYNITSVILSYGDWNMYDWIHVVKTSLTLDKATRELRLTDCVLLRAIQGIYRPGMRS